MLATITRAGRSDEYGRALLVGATYDGTINQVRALVAAGYATTTESLFDGGSGGDALSPSDGMTTSQVVATQALVSGDGMGGLRTGLFGDSMTDWYNMVISASSATYNAAANTLTIVTPTTHTAWPGMLVSFWNYDYPSLRNRQRLPVASMPNSTSLVFNLPTVPAGVPNGALTGTVQYRPENVRGVNNPILWAQMQMGWPLNVVVNAAKSGEYSRSALANISELLDAKPQLVIMQSLGINDQTYAYQDGIGRFLTEAETIANNRAIYSAILASGADLIVGTITPVSSAETARAKKDIMDRVVRINDDLWNYTRGKARMQVYDAYGAYIDPTNVTGLAFANTMRIDGIHHSIRGGARLGALIAACVRRYIPGAVRSTLPQSVISNHDAAALATSSASAAADGTVTVIFAAAHNWRPNEVIRCSDFSDVACNGVFTILTTPASTQLTFLAPGVVTGALSGSRIISRMDNIFRNPLLTSATGGTVSAGSGSITGVVAQYLACSVGNTSIGYIAVASVAADDSGFGSKQVLAVTACSADGTPRSQITVAGSTSYAATKMRGNGSRWQFECLLRLKSTSWADTPISDFRAYLQVTGGDGLTYTAEALFSWDGTEAGWLTANQELHLRTPPVQVPAGVTVSNSAFMVWCRHSAAITGAATFTMEMARISVRDITDLTVSL